MALEAIGALTGRTIAAEWRRPVSEPNRRRPPQQARLKGLALLESPRDLTVAD